MGITVLTLAIASLRGEQILDHQSQKMVDVKLIGYKQNQPEYVLIYPDDRICYLDWVDGQATAGKEAGLTLEQVADLSNKVREKKFIKKIPTLQLVV